MLARVRLPNEAANEHSHRQIAYVFRHTAADERSRLTAYQWALCALTASPSAAAYYDAHDPGPKTGQTARRKLANKLVGVLHGP